ncbi:hypothetical protein [Lelliottia wanjuensis]|uniref:Uncharacterized protein n=1 Tax=Lelliottia wanjuensis TaxID=3050585 RepID=A0AAP4FU68_9ENTR|nr:MULTISPECIES: hypothetical protein [unclassified Lelliottia]MDK9362915.1 hypothetical protein [Lelliottia sp. V106_12]MDK9616600.1 hypothetical protein [Lelliottia sp. V106_9]
MYVKPISIKPNRNKVTLILLTIITMNLAACDSAEKREFMTGCKMSVRNSSICSCTWDKMTELYSPDKLKAIGQGQIHPPTGFQQQMGKAMSQCMAK